MKSDFMIMKKSPVTRLKTQEMTKIMADASGIRGEDGKVVIRPDSGDPVDVICGDPRAEFGSAEFKGTAELLWETFGGRINSTGYRELDSHIGMIYGDSITLERANDISWRLKHKGFATTNMVYGIGSFTYQYVTRDTFGMAIKSTAGYIVMEKRFMYSRILKQIME